jgi:hypothetical protein
MGVYSPDTRREQNVILGFVDRLADMMVRLCGVVLHRSLLAQRLAALVLEPWRVEESGETCRAARTLTLVLDTGAKIDVFIAAIVGLDGSPRGLLVESKFLGCTGAWGQV